jgi:hypothetical protein
MGLNQERANKEQGAGTQDPNGALNTEVETVA